MTLLGKIFTMLIFIMSLVYMAFAVAVYATHKNWKDEALTNLKPALDQSQKTIAALQAEINDLTITVQRERSARVGALSGLETKLVHAQEQLRQREAELATLTSTHATAVQAMDQVQTRLAGLVQEVDTLRADVRKAQNERDTMFTQVVALTDEAHRLQGTLDQLETTRQTLAAQVARYKNVMDKHGLTEYSLVSHIPPAIDGLVQAVGERNLIEVSLGADDGLQSGHELEVYRNNTYLGRVVIRKAAPNAAVAEIIPQYRVGTIRVGDRVATKVK